MTDKQIAVFILTYNEHLHIERCIRSVLPVSSQVFLVDCGSTDGTVEIATGLGAVVVHHAWENHHARQTNWAIDNLPITAPWVMRIDADEIVTGELAKELNERLPDLPADVNGLILKRHQVFLGRTLLWGGNYPIRLMRVWRRGLARCEDRWMDEHIVIASGRTLELSHDLEDRNLNNLRWWTNKEANYAVREALDTLLSRRVGRQDQAAQQGSHRRYRRWLKKQVYARMPPFVRPTIFFAYRYVFRLGFLDGIPGLVWHVLQGFWYRFLVDAMVYEIDKRVADTGEDAVSIAEKLYGLSVTVPAASSGNSGDAKQSSVETS